MFIKHMAELIAMMTGGLAFSTLTFGVLWLRARDRATRAEATLEALRISGGRLESNPALDAIAEEVERIGEGQRFLTRVMSEHVSGAKPPAQRLPGIVTPH